MKAILYHFPATDPAQAPMADISLEWQHHRMVYRQGDPVHSKWLKDMLVGATLNVRPVPIADEAHPTMGGFRLIDLDDETPASLGARIMKQLAELRDAGCPYATIVLSLDP